MAINHFMFKRRNAVLAVFVIMMMAISVFAYADENTSEAYERAHTLVKSEEYKSAAKIITKAQKQGEDTIEMSLLLTEAYAGRIDQVGQLKKMGLAKKIKISMEHSLKLDPENLDAMDGLVQFHQQAPGIVGGDKKIARSLIEKIAKKDTLRGHIMRAEMASIDKNYPLALTNFEACIRIKPEELKCQYQIGKMAQLGDFEHEKGKAAFLGVIKTGHENKSYIAHAHYRLGHLYKQTGDKDSARKQYELAVTVDDLKDAKKALEELK